MLKTLRMVLAKIRHPKLTVTPDREWQVHDALVGLASTGEVEMPWGEKVKLLPGGDIEHLMPLTPSQMRNLRSAVAGDRSPRTMLMRFLLGK